MGIRRTGKLPLRSKDEDGQIDAPGLQAEHGRLTKPAKGMLKVFNDEDEDMVLHQPATGRALVTKPVTNLEDDDNDDEDDDEAPEAISTQKAESTIKESVKASQKAVQEQAAEQKRKRQQRDTLFKQQAKDRKRAEKVSAAMTAKKQPPEPNKVAQATEPRSTGNTSGRRRAEKTRFTGTLPAEFLTDSSSEEEDDDAVAHLAPTQPRQKKRKVSSIEQQIGRSDRAPRDVAMGSTLYRVAKRSEERMAPKATRYSRGSKDALLKRNRATAKLRTSGGFFAKR